MAGSKYDSKGYVISRKNYLNGLQNQLISQPEKTFIYVLFTAPSKGVPSKPFYVGQAKNIKKRFANHTQIISYTAFHNKAVIAHIVGHVSDAIALKAEYSLIRRLSAAGYLLNNLQPSLNKTIFSSLAAKSLNQYIQTEHEVDHTKVIQQWKKEWHNVNEKFTEKETISSEVLDKVILTRSYVSSEARNLSKRIAGMYDSETNLSKIMFFLPPNKEEELALEELNFVFAQMKKDWLVSGNLDFNKEITFKPSYRLLAAAKAYKRKR
jgi:predicted GIY-YIG superfamily endonuclease